MPQHSVATIIVQPLKLVREGLTSLISQHSYNVVAGVNCAAEINPTVIAADDQKLVLLVGSYSATQAIAESVRVREIWPDSKLVLVFEKLCPVEFQALIASDIDGFVSLLLPGEILIKALDTVMRGDARVVILAGSEHRELLANSGKRDSGACAGARPEMPRVAEPDVTIVPEEPKSNGSIGPNEVGPERRSHSVRLGHTPKLSEREFQILDGLVKGHANKVIARTCEITEATVKVHMKSILRKIQVANRTQAAVWALENRFVPEDVKERLFQATADGTN